MHVIHFEKKKDNFDTSKSTQVTPSNYCRVLFLSDTLFYFFVPFIQNCNCEHCNAEVWVTLFCIAIITALCIQCCILLLIYALCIDQVASWWSAKNGALINIVLDVFLMHGAKNWASCSVQLASVRAWWRHALWLHKGYVCGMRTELHQLSKKTVSFSSILYFVQLSSIEHLFFYECRLFQLDIYKYLY
jgi:hypothetical protein